MVTIDDGMSETCNSQKTSGGDKVHLYQLQDKTQFHGERGAIEKLNGPKDLI